MFAPKSIVLAKVKGYPQWPAMVLEESLLPEFFLTKKPKLVKNSASIYPVRFFSDDTYIWIKESDIKPLNEEMIKSHLETPKRRKDKLLELAYELALNPLDMEAFVKYGSKGEPEEEEEEDEDEEEEDEQPQKKQKSSKTSKSSKSTKSTKSTKTSKSAKSSKSSKSKKESKPTPKPKPKTESPEPETPPDDDWGLEEDYDANYKQGNFIYNNLNDQINFQQTFPKSDTIVNNINTITKKFQSISDKLIPLLLSSDPIDESQVLELLHKLSDLNPPKAIIMKSNLFRVLVLTSRKPEETFPYEKIKNSITQWLQLALTLQVTENTLDDIQTPQAEKKLDTEPIEEKPHESNGKPELVNGHSTESVTVNT